LALTLRAPARLTHSANKHRLPPFATGAPALAIVILVGACARVWELNRVGFNSDEAVYAGQAAALADDVVLKQFFPVFRAHPILFQAVLSLAFQFGVSDLVGRLVAVAVGLLTVGLMYLVGRDLYGPAAGMLAALLLALMPYHVVVTRQVLLDGPMTLFSTLTLLALVRFALTERSVWLYAAGAGFGLTFLSKTNGIVMVGALYTTLALSSALRVRILDLVIAGVGMVLVVLPYPVTVALAGRAETGGQYLAWQLFRRPNHEWSFYLTTVPVAIGTGVILAAVAGLWLLRRERSWRETLLISWIVVPVAFFQLWPTKGFQYLLPIAPAVALLASRFLTRWEFPEVRLGRRRLSGPSVQLGLVCVVLLTLFFATWERIQPSETGEFLAGSGGVVGGREVGSWISANVPAGAEMLAIGPSMANIIQFYGHRKTYGLSVSPNPLKRNPSYEPVNNPDQRIRNNELHYVVWDSFSAARTPFFAEAILRYVSKYHGRVVHTEFIAVSTSGGGETQKPVIVVYEVRP
jgi:4-amino-4-deoxy-L-arabinose transferase-like glycosyltransferase